MNNEIELLTHQTYKIENLILDGKFTKTSHFLLPGLHLSNNLETFTKYFVNAFIEDDGITHIIKNPVFVLCRTKFFDENWKKFEAGMKASPRCVYEYDVGKNDDDYLLMFLFEFPAAYRADYFRFLESEYSKFSEHYKKLFKETMTNEKGEIVENSLYGIVNKTPEFKKKIEAVIGEKLEPRQEYWEKWRPEREIFRKK